MNAILALALVLVVMMFIVGGKQGLANFFALAANALLMIFGRDIKGHAGSIRLLVAGYFWLNHFSGNDLFEHQSA